jgi:hypothetical protein
MNYLNLFYKWFYKVSVVYYLIVVHSFVFFSLMPHRTGFSGGKLVWRGQRKLFKLVYKMRLVIISRFFRKTGEIGFPF